MFKEMNKNGLLSWRIDNEWMDDRDGWNGRNGLNILKILHLVSERVDCVLVIVLVLSLIIK